MTLKLSKYFTLAIVFAFSCNKTDNPVVATEWTTLDEIQGKGIVSYVGKEILLKTKVTWHHISGAFPRRGLTIDTTHASAIKVNFENGDEYVSPGFRGQERGNMFLMSQELIKVPDDSLIEQYLFRNRLLDTSSVYLLEGSFGFRSWLNVDSTKLADTAFIRQSNDVTYWSQTFQFNLGEMLQTSGVP
jgi:hypothetical protein